MSSVACGFETDTSRQPGQGKEKALGQSWGPTLSHRDDGATSPALPMSHGTGQKAGPQEV